MNHNERLDQINNFRDKDKEKREEKNDPRGMRHFDFDQAPRTVKLVHIEKIGWQTIEDINHYSLYNASTQQALQGIAIACMKRLRTIAYYDAKTTKEDLSKIDKAIYELSTTLMNSSPEEGSEDDDDDLC